MCVRVCVGVSDCVCMCVFNFECLMYAKINVCVSGTYREGELFSFYFVHMRVYDGEREREREGQSL